MPFWTDLLNRIARRQGENGDTFPVSIVDGDKTVGITNDGKLMVDTSGGALPTGAATAAKQDSEIAELQSIKGKDFATQTTLAAILAKIIVSPATEAKQDVLETVLKAIRDTAGIKKIADTVDVQVVGGIPEYSWFASAEERPEPKDPDKPAIGIEVDTDTMEIAGLLWNGEEWEEE